MTCKLMMYWMKPWEIMLIPNVLKVRYKFKKKKKRWKCVLLQGTKMQLWLSQMHGWCSASCRFKTSLSLSLSLWEVLDVNKQACKLFEYTRNELIGRTLTFLLKTSQMSEDVLGEEILDSAGNLITISGKVVWTLGVGGYRFQIIKANDAHDMKSSHSAHMLNIIMTISFIFGIWSGSWTLGVR